VEVVVCLQVVSIFDALFVALFAVVLILKRLCGELFAVVTLIESQ
jgi:hypothetical protein